MEMNMEAAAVVVISAVQELHMVWVSSKDSIQYKHLQII